MRSLYLDCFSGISGNMFLGALIDLGLPERRLREELAKLDIKEYELIVKRVEKQGISATYANVRIGSQHHHRHLPDIYKIIDQSSLPQAVKEDSKKVFLRLAEAEAKVHGTTAEKIHFHEVGAVDAIIDIVGTVFGLFYLEIDRIYTSKLRTGSGFVKCAHGRMPVPAPATAELLRGIPYESGEIAKELVTPTGAALVSTLSRKESLPDGFVSEAVGYGAGSWDLEIPNVLRAVLGSVEASAPAESGGQLVIETNIDDLNPQIYSYVMDKLFAAGARDVWMTPILMKKNRPATKLSVLADTPMADTMVAILLSETSAIGVRFYPVNRVTAEREVVSVDTPWGPARVKVCTYQGRICNIAPEFEDCRRLAEEGAVPLKTIWREVLSVYGQKYGDRK